MAIILGASTMTEQPQEWGYSPDKGFDTTRSWKGPASAVESVTATLSALGWSFRVRHLPSGLAQIDATISGNASSNGGSQPSTVDVVDTWELYPNSVQKDLLEADCSAVGACTAQQISWVKTYLATRSTDAITAEGWTTWNGYQTTLINLANAGVTSWEIDAPVLRHSYSIPRGVNYSFPWNNIWKIHSTAQLIANEGVPADYVLDLATIGALFTNPTRNDGVPFHYGWRKRFPHQSIGANGKREVNIEYHFGLWATDLYSVVT